ncbi:hypothetical protein N665_1274s0011 [Sinapis alba]|nr:hypothetical protein N665_1274s0011 [Sinapis alba]
MKLEDRVSSCLSVVVLCHRRFLAARTANLQRVIRVCTKRDQQKPCQSYESFWSGSIAMVWIANF